MSDTDSDVNEFRMEEQLFDTESDQQSSENIFQKTEYNKKVKMNTKFLLRSLMK